MSNLNSDKEHTMNKWILYYKIRGVGAWEAKGLPLASMTELCNMIIKIGDQWQIEEIRFGAPFIPRAGTFGDLSPDELAELNAFEQNSKFECVDRELRIFKRRQKQEDVQYASHDSVPAMTRFKVKFRVDKGRKWRTVSIDSNLDVALAVFLDLNPAVMWHGEPTFMKVQKVDLCDHDVTLTKDECGRIDKFRQQNKFATEV